MTDLHSRLARVVGEVLDDLYATPDLRAEAVTAAVLTELGLREEKRTPGRVGGMSHQYPPERRWVSPWIEEQP